MNERPASDSERGRIPSVSAARVGLLVATAIALLFGLAGLVTRPVWHDELFTLRLARMPLASILAAIETDSGPPLHYLLSHLLWLLVRWPEGSWGFKSCRAELGAALLFVGARGGAAISACSNVGRPHAFRTVARFR